MEECIHQGDGYPAYGLCVKREADTIPIQVDVDGKPGNDVMKASQKYIPGPVIRVKQGEKVKITIINRTIDASISVHWCVILLQDMT